MKSTMRMLAIGLLLGCGCAAGSGGGEDSGNGGGGGTAEGGGGERGQGRSPGSDAEGGANAPGAGQGADAAGGLTPAVKGGNGAGGTINMGGKSATGGGPATGGSGGSTVNSGNTGPTPSGELWQDFGASDDLTPWNFKAWTFPGSAKIVNGWLRVDSSMSKMGDEDLHATCLAGRVPDSYGSKWQVDIRYRQETWQVIHHGSNHPVAAFADWTNPKTFRYMVQEGEGFYLRPQWVERRDPVNGWVLDFDEKARWDFPMPDNGKLVVRLTHEGSRLSYSGSHDEGKTFAPIHSLNVDTTDSERGGDHRWIGMCDTQGSGFTEFQWIKLRKL